MRLVVQEEPGVLSLNYTWIPTWLGINNAFKNEMEKHLKSKIQGLVTDDAGLEKANQLVLDYICAQNPGIKGLDTYLDALKYVYLE
jgi:hypothetical protein